MDGRSHKQEDWQYVNRRSKQDKREHEIAVDTWFAVFRWLGIKGSSSSFSPANLCNWMVRLLCLNPKE
ncbi:hypothetical protein L1987_48187 [Smallanthus sonchifolius]|uniref:Uncharacterized protein n=1 Tax=Smallanthus sonchifolius TaxID=185202 RepID=A0ACB9FR41_9ASTR|nr:hypothetical protein L1987_48187 [Smallanthus sonchifolius]